jgi:hypothetical protein
VTDGQPWLGNALALDIINNQLKNDYSVIIDELLVE